MSLESKAKSTGWIFDQYDKCRYNKVHGSQMWVPLEEAQKIENILAEKMSEIQGLLIEKGEWEGLKPNYERRFDELEGQIKKVAEILDGPIYGPNNTCLNLVNKIKDALLIPRLENQEKKQP